MLPEIVVSVGVCTFTTKAVRLPVGSSVGDKVGQAKGFEVGFVVGPLVGASVGVAARVNDGVTVGPVVGDDAVGFPVGPQMEIQLAHLLGQI